MRNRLAAAAATMSCVLMTASISPSTARAASGEGGSIRISTKEIDVSTEHGSELLARRIRSAAAELCLNDLYQPVGMKVRALRCYRETLADGLRQMDLVLAARNIRSVQTAQLVGAPARTPQR